MDAQIVLTVQGTIDSCSTKLSDNVYCRYGFTMDGDWEKYQGPISGITPSSHSEGSFPSIFNYPFQISMVSSSPFGWPQIVIAVYGLNTFGYDMIVGYGGAHVPMTPGRHEIEVPLFAPKPETFIQKISTFFTGLYPELINISSIATGEDRDVLQTTSQGSVKITFNVTMSDPEPLGLCFM